MSCVQITLVASRTQSTHRLKADTTSSNRVHVTEQHMFLLSPVRGCEPSSMRFGKRSSRWGRSTCGGKHLQYAVLSGGKRQGGRSGGIQEATRRLCEKRRWLLDWGGIFALLSISTFLSPFLLFIFCAEYKTLHTQVFSPIPTSPSTSHKHTHTHTQTNKQTNANKHTSSPFYLFSFFLPFHLSLIEQPTFFFLLSLHWFPLT